MISADYNAMITAAKKMSSAAENYVMSLNKFYNIIENLKLVWTGEDKDKFVSVVENYKDDLSALGTIVNNYANFLVDTTKNLEQAQNDVSSAASKL